jgi:hypothetical protein
MAKEFEEERLTVERLWNHFHKDFITLQEIAMYDGCCVRTVKQRYGINGGVCLTTLAHLKCKLSRK